MRACGICRALFCLRRDASRVVIWNGLRDDVLRAAVRMYGRRWHLVAVAVDGGCSDRAARHRWERVSHAGGVVRTGIKAQCARNLGELVVVRALEGDGSLFVAVDFLLDRSTLF